MSSLKVNIIALFLISGLHSNSQYYAWNDLAISLPQDWSTKNNNGVLTYSNYNLRPQIIQTFYLYPPQAYSGTPDTLFGFVWQQKVALGDTSLTIPRWRRFNTLDGVLLLQGSLQEGTGEYSTFRQLSIYILEKSFQFCLLETTDSKTYKLIQSEWQERLMGVRKIVTKKR